MQRHPKSRKWSVGDEATTADIEEPCLIIDLDEQDATLATQDGLDRKLLRPVSELIPIKPMTEVQAVSALCEVARRWPDSLWLFAANGRLCIMRKNAEGKRAVTKDGAMDQRYVIAVAPIEADGGDW